MQMPVQRQACQSFQEVTKIVRIKALSNPLTGVWKVAFVEGNSESVGV
jgi:hypothetical protein